MWNLFNNYFLQVFQVLAPLFFALYFVFFSQLLHPVHFWLTLNFCALFFRKCINLGFFVSSIHVLIVCTSWEAFSLSQESFSASLSCLSVSLKSCLVFLISLLPWAIGDSASGARAFWTWKVESHHPLGQIKQFCLVARLFAKTCWT